MVLIDKIFACVSNQLVLELLNLQAGQTRYIKIGKDAGSAFDEGSHTFYEHYASLLPEITKVTLSIYNLLVNPNNGEIFAFQWGRFTFVLRCDFSKIDIENKDSCRKSTTLDGEVDFTGLGENWSIVDLNFEGEEQEHFRNAYQLSLKK